MNPHLFLAYVLAVAILLLIPGPASGRRRLQGRITGTLLIGLGCGLLLARRAG